MCGGLGGGGRRQGRQLPLLKAGDGPGLVFDRHPEAPSQPVHLQTGMPMSHMDST